MDQVYANALHEKHGVEGARKIMADPMQNSQHLSQFIDGSRDQILEKFQRESSQMATQQTIEKDYEKNKHMTETQNDVGADFVNKSQTVIEKSEQTGLNEGLKPNLSSRVENSIKNAKSSISHKKSNLVENRSQEFSKHNEDVKKVDETVFD